MKKENLGSVKALKKQLGAAVAMDAQPLQRWDQVRMRGL